MDGQLVMVSVPFSLWTSNMGEELYEVVSSSVWEENPEVDGPVMLDRD